MWRHQLTSAMAATSSFLVEIDDAHTCGRLSVSSSLTAIRHQVPDTPRFTPLSPSPILEAGGGERQAQAGNAVPAAKRGKGDANAKSSCSKVYQVTTRASLKRVLLWFRYFWCWRYAPRAVPRLDEPRKKKVVHGDRAQDIVHISSIKSHPSTVVQKPAARTARSQGAANHVSFAEYEAIQVTRLYQHQPQHDDN